MSLQRSYSQDNLPTQFASNVCDRNETNCHASASVKSKIQACSDLIREAIYQLNLRVMIVTNKMLKIMKHKMKFCGGGLNTSWSPPHPPSKKRPSWTMHDKGLKKKIKGGTVVYGRKAFWGGLKHRGLPHHDIPLTNSSCYRLTPLVSCPKVETFGKQGH